MNLAAMALGLAVPFLTSIGLGHAVPEPPVQTAQAQTNAFDGNWVGSGRNARASARNRCGDGPLVELTVQDGEAKAVFKLTVPHSKNVGLKRHVFPINGSVDDDGALTLSGHQADATATLSASGEPSEGTWEIGSLACDGTFRVRRKP